MNQNTNKIAQAGIIAAGYTVLSLISLLFGQSPEAIVQLRLSEALCILPVFTVSAVPGLFVGCLLSNLLCGASILDVALGSIATLIGAILTRKLKDEGKWAFLPPIVANALIIPFVMKFSYGLSYGYIPMMFYVAISEFISCFLLGLIVRKQIKKIWS